MDNDRRPTGAGPRQKGGDVTAGPDPAASDSGTDTPEAETGAPRPVPVFADPRQRRRLVLRAAWTAAAAVLTVWFAGFGLSLYFVGKLPGAGLLQVSAEGALALPGLAAPEDGAEGAESCVSPPLARPYLVTDPGLAARPAVWGHLPRWSEWTVASLARKCGVTDVLAPEWYALSLAEPRLEILDAEETRRALVAQSRTPAGGPEIVPVLALDLWREGAAPGLGDARLRARLVAEIAGAARHGRHQSLCLRPQATGRVPQPALAALVAEAAAALAAEGRRTCLILPAGAPLWRDAAALAGIDRMVLLAFHQPGPGAAPAPLAPQPWFEAAVAEAVAAVGSERLVVALGNLAYDWVSGRPAPEPIAFSEAMRRAAAHGGRIDLVEGALNTRVRLVDDHGRRHQIWLLDAVSMHNQLAALARHRLAGIALWSIGTEDPGVWPLLEPGGPGSLDPLKEIDLSDYVGYLGEGSFRRIAAEARPGHRALAQDGGTGLITRQVYTAIPEPYSFERFGAARGGQVALTFDDGPDARFTAPILDILREEGVPAAFFLVGRNILQNPDLVRRMVAEGHEIGSHTFFHPHIDQIPDYRTRFEMNAVQRLITGITGRSTVLFRTPYGRGEGPLTGAEVRPLAVIDAQGYVIVGSEIVPPDWAGLGARDIVAFVRRELERGGGNVIVLHDAGGDRSATVAALRPLIAELRAEGHSFVSLAELLGTTREALMPPEGGPRATFDGASFSFLSWAGRALVWIFFAAVIGGLARSLAILAAAHLRRRRSRGGAEFLPPVTVLVPAYDEEGVILASLAAVLGSDHPDLRVIVIDDGSRDRTAALVEGAYGGDPRVRLLRQPNQGKWRALDNAYALVETEFVVAIDADTLIAPDAVRLILQPFRDPAVGAAAGMVRVGNRGRLLTALQALEYVTAQNIERRAAEWLNGMMVVPGAIGAWRVAAVRSAGLYSGQTLTEDADLTVAVLRAGYRVVFEERAVSVTEVPQTLRHFLRQRLRWTFGMMQTAWKHRRATREGRPVGLVSIPDLWIFGIGLGLLAPVADLIVLGVLFDLLVDVALGQPVLSHPLPVAILWGYVALPAVDLLTALAAFRLDRHESPALLLLVPFQRLLYRPLLYVTVWRAVLRALSGRLASWGRIIRLGTVRLPRA